MSKKNEDELPCPILIHVSHDGYMRCISLHVHMDKPMTPREFMAELAMVVADYQDYPDELFVESEEIEFN